jgi:hypothetical protein
LQLIEHLQTFSQNLPPLFIVISTDMIDRIHSVVNECAIIPTI